MSYLDGNDVDMVRYDLAKNPPSRQLLERLIDAKDPAVFLNPRSPSYRERGLADRKLSKKEVIDLMLEDPNLIRRPLVIRGKKAVFGFLPDQYDELFQR